jgi:hypothetical protein
MGKLPGKDYFKDPEVDASISTRWILEKEVPTMVGA